MYRLLLFIFLPVALFAVPGTSVRLGLNSNIYCYQDEFGSYLVKKQSNKFVDLYFDTEITSLQNKLRILRLRRRSLLKTREQQKISSNLLRIRSTKKLIQDIKGCRSGLFFTGTTPADYSEACLVVGGKLETSDPVAQIINGNRCFIGNGPTVQLLLNNGEATCSGSMIAGNVVLTAAHCLEGVSAVSVVQGYKRYTAKYFDIHPLYNTLDNEPEAYDLGIVVLGENVTSRIAEILNVNNLQNSEAAIIGGYGIEQDGRSGVLKAGKMKIFSYTTNGIVAKFDGSGANTCSGDSGGPFYVKRGTTWYIAGLTSSGLKQDCTAGDVSYFSNLTSPAVQTFISSYILG